jgi:hypothetical protein
MEMPIEGPTALFLKSLVTDGAEMMRVRAAEKGLSLRLNEPPRAPAGRKNRRRQAAKSKGTGLGLTISRQFRGTDGGNHQR